MKPNRQMGRYVRTLPHVPVAPPPSASMGLYDRARTRRPIRSVMCMSPQPRSGL